MRRRRGHGVPIMFFLVLISVLAVVATVPWLVAHVLILAGIALLIGGAHYLGHRHEQTRARPGTARPLRQARPAEPAAVTSVRAATPPLAGYHQAGSEPGTEPPEADRDSLLTDPYPGLTRSGGRHE